MSFELTIDLEKAAKFQNKALVLLILEQLNVDLTPKYVDKSGLKWYPALPGSYNHYAATFLAECLGLRLPTKEEFELAELEGIRSKLCDFRDSWFWSSSERFSYYAWIFYGYSGGVGVDYRGSDFYSVRLVSK